MSNRFGLSSAIEKPKQARSTLRRLMSYIFQHPWLFLVAVAMVITSNFLQLLGPYLIGIVIDLLKDSHELPIQIKQILLWLILVYLGAFLLSYLQSLLMIRLSQAIIKQLRQDLFHKFMDVSVGYIDKHQIGDMMSRITYDIDTINTSLSTDFVQLLGSLVTVIGSFAMMVVLSPLLLSVFVITIPAAFATTYFLTKKTRPLFRKRSVALGDLNGFVEETISGQKTIKVYSQEATMLKQFQAKNQDASEAYYQADYYGSINGPAISFINNISLALISLFGSLLYLFSWITLGNISSFLLYSRKFSGPINESANIFNELQASLAAAERVFRVLDKPNEADSALAVSKAVGTKQGEVLFRHVQFGYDPGKPVIQDFTQAISPGSLVAIVGPTGAGKTTLINLLMRFYDVQSGTISLHGVPIDDMSLPDIRQQFTMVLQDSWLFYGTIYENIVYGNPDVTKEDVIAIAKQLHIHSFISQLPQGYDSVITDDGVNLSKGQKQLLTIARALLQKRSMVILDEATSNVDTRTELHIQKAMRYLMKDKTCFVIAHRLSTIQHADLILVMQQGTIVEQGTHEQLMQAKSTYYQIFTSQFL